MELRQLQYFVAICEEGSVTQAARRLNVVQPALSQQVSKLEDEIGQPLFFRTSRGMSQTDAGKEAYRLYSGILKDLDQAQRVLKDGKDAVRGSVSIGVVSSVANNALGATLKIFAEKYPDVHVHATGGYTTDLQEMLRAAELDLVVVNRARNSPDPNALDVIREDLALVGAPTTQIGSQFPVALARLSKLKLVIPSRRHGLRLVIDRALAEANIVLSPQMEFDELKPIEDFVQESDFFTILPPIAVHRALTSGRLTAYPVSPLISRRLVIMTNPARPLSTAGKLLADEIRERMIDFTFEIENKLRSDEEGRSKKIS